MPSLYDQIKSQWGNYGEWDAAGVDRAAELARLLESKGITDISQIGKSGTTGYLNMSTGEFKEGSGEGLNLNPGNINESIDYWQPYTRNQFTLGDASYGYLGDVNNDNTISNSGTSLGDYLKKNDLVGWSAQGHGNVGYFLKTDPKTGKVYIAPEWGSSSDTGEIRDFAKAAAAMAGLTYGLDIALS